MREKEKKKEERDTQINYLENSTATQAVATIVTTFNRSHMGAAKAIEPLVAAIKPNDVLSEKNSGAAAAVKSIADATHAVISENSMKPVIGTAATMTTVMKPHRDVEFFNSSVLAALESAAKTPELQGFQLRFEKSARTMGAGLSVVSDYVNNLTSRWNASLAVTDIAKRSIAAQNLAIVRILPDYVKLDLPRGSKRILKSLTKATAEKLTRTEVILFDPKEKDFYHKDSPERKLTADQITVVESSQNLFADITLDELLSFESQLCDDVTFALNHPVGKRIFEIIKGWNKFINFDADIYYHARKIEEGRSPFLDQEMMKAPVNISSHGRYNAIGKSCYYIAETKDGALNEISRHSGGKKINIQVIGLRPIKEAKIIDLSGEIKGRNRFMEHLRFTVENEDKKIVKNYLLPNFVASCCKKIGIEGIKYKSTDYNCCVLWKDDYFEFVEGSRDIIYGV